MDYLFEPVEDYLKYVCNGEGYVDWKDNMSRGGLDKEDGVRDQGGREVESFWLVGIGNQAMRWRLELADGSSSTGSKALARHLLATSKEQLQNEITTHAKD